MLSSIENIYSTYFNKRMLTMLALGFSSGFPYLLVFGTLSFWLKDLNISYALIGAFSLVKIPYSLKWAWSPLIDNVKLPFLYKLGRRRSWAVVIQILLFMTLFTMAFTNPETQTITMAVLAFCASFLSASQDIVLDAFRVESFEKEPDKQATGVAVYVLGYRFGLILSGAGAIYLASFLNWSQVYLIMSMPMFIGLAAVLLVKEPQKYQYKKYKLKIKDAVKFLKNSIVGPFKNFAEHKNWLWILIFIFTYRLSDAYFNPMSFPFYVDMGFTKTEIASVIKIYGMIAAILGGLAGGIIVMKIGQINSLILFGFTQCITTLLFAVQAHYGHNMPLFMVVVSLENFSSGLATTAMVAYISSLCNTMYTATQYALLSSVMSLSRDIFASTSGVVAAHVSWEVFFIISGFMSFPSILIIWFCLKKETIKSLSNDKK